MLDPDRRELLLDALRPPTGYTLDLAVGTTFTLDLQALLLAPLAFAFFETSAGDEDDTAGPDPVALLAALREAADRLHIFCQAGRIVVPREYRRVMALVEDSVHAVAAPRPGGIFHPKVWALRYAASGEPARYRLVSLSRNLTFDRSWDTLVRLEGVSGRRPQGASAPLGRLVRTLPELAVRPLDACAQVAVSQLGDELATVEWEVPDPFGSVQLHALGLAGTPPQPFGGRIDRLLVISPFLGPGALGRLGPQATERFLVSRPESMDAVGSATLAGYEETFVLAAPAQGAEPEGDSPSDALTPAPLSGLHAKVYVADAGRSARVITGSANATDAALSTNVEFLVELEGPKTRCGIDAVLKPGQGQASLRDLLEPYAVQNVDPLEPDAHEQLLRDLERYADDLASQGFRAVVDEGGAEATYELTLRGEASLPAEVRANVRPLTNRAGASVPLVSGADGTEARFPSLSFEALTSFFIVEIALARGGLTESTAFVVNAVLIGAPDDRLSRLLTIELGSRRSVLRYLLLLLASGGIDADALLGLTIEKGGAADNGRGSPSLPLLESLIHTLSRAPEQLDAVERLVVDLERTEEGRALLPEDFLDIWGAFRAVRQEAVR